jgi:hypothetical protein
MTRGTGEIQLPMLDRRPYVRKVAEIKDSNPSDGPIETA